MKLTFLSEGSVYKTNAKYQNKNTCHWQHKIVQIVFIIFNHICAKVIPGCRYYFQSQIKTENKKILGRQREKL